MKVTVSEALRLKNEITTELTHYQRSLSDVNYGYWTDLEDDTRLDVGVAAKSSVAFHTSYEKLLICSMQINVILAKFNVDNQLNQMVFEKKNNEQLLNFYSYLASQSKVKIESKEVLGKMKKYKYTPYWTQDEVRIAIKTCKENIRMFLTKIDKLNAKEVDIPFSYGEIENLRMCE